MRNDSNAIVLEELKKNSLGFLNRYLKGEEEIRTIYTDRNDTVIKNTIKKGLDPKVVLAILERLDKNKWSLHKDETTSNETHTLGDLMIQIKQNASGND